VPALGIALVGCASAMPETPGARRSAEIDELKARVTQLAQPAAVSEAEIARLRQQVAALESRVGGTARRDGATAAPPAAPPRAAATQPPPAPPLAATRPASAPPSPATPRIEETDLTIEEVEVVLPPARPASPGASAVSAPGPLGPVERQAQAVYDQAYTYYHQGRYDDAEARFQEFLAMSPASELSDNAQYWIGACRFAKRDFRGALAAFRRTVETYPDENKVPDALFKMGQSLEELGDPAEARIVYEDLVQRFPDTAAATLAAERRAKLR
jgi:tol-pal system protein YbgF